MLRFKDAKTAKKFWIAVIFLTIVAGSFLIAYPLFSKANMASENITAAEETKASAQKKVDDYQSYRDNYDLYVDEDQTVSTKFPSKMNTVEYTAFVQRAAREVGLPVNKITELTVSAPVVAAGAAPAAPAATPDPAAAGADAAAAPAEGADAAATTDPAAAATGAAPAAAAGGNIAESTVHISVTGSMTQVNNFATRLMSGVRDFTLTTYSVSGGEGNEVTATIDGKALYYRDLEKPAAEAAPAPATETAPATEEGN